jgi:hypothetical protein
MAALFVLFAYISQYRFNQNRYVPLPDVDR